ncbi:MAG TPA: pectinesterase family protein [Candidatus Acidoferrales bacterium]|nr:pectinesterase family protein [Candidatus Acidoferrales bacterium]
MIRIGAILFVLALRAQDTRQVAEPRFPSACEVLTARLAAPGGVLPDAAEQSPDTTRLQTAIDSCAPGRAVELKAAGDNNIFLSGPIRLKSGVTLLVDANTALFASRNPRDYDVRPGSCGIVGDRGPGCQPLILADRAPGSGIMGDGAIDGRGGAKLIGQDASWWDLAKQAKIYDRSQAVTRILVVRQSDNFTLYRITLRNSPNFHVSVSNTNGFTAWGVKIRTPKTARNTDGIDPSSSSNVTIKYCDIDTGDDDVAIKSGASGPSSHITVEHNHFYNGHGMSIGSNTDGGVSHVRVNDLSLDGTDNGIRIKSDPSRGGLVEDVAYENVCMRNVPNPVILTSMYTTYAGTKVPVYRDIRLKNVRAVTPGWLTLLGADRDHRLGVSFDNVMLDGLTTERTKVENADVRELKGAPVDCSDRFVRFPEIPTAPEAKVTVIPEDPTLYVAASGTGDYWSIQRAIDMAPAEGAVISVAPGRYREVLTITKPNITIRGPYADASRTVVVFDKSAGTSGGTFNSATVNVKADNFTAENVTFANDWNRTHEQVPVGSQALAVSVTADRAIFRNVRLLGNQDTVYVSKGRQYFTGCYIEGNVDFIFGDGKALFENCEIHSTPHSTGYITAQGKSAANQDSMFVFHQCRLTAAPGVDNVWLGRPWRPYASVVFLDTEMGAHINAAGWREWHPGETSYMDTVFYGEFQSTGPGAHPGERDPHTKKLTQGEAAQYDTAKFLGGRDEWKPR